MSDFIENVQGHTRDVFLGKVYFNRFKKPITDVKTEIFVDASVVVDLRNGSQFLIQLGESCGFDYPENSRAPGDVQGSEVADNLESTLRVWCNENDLGVLPGIVDY